MSSENKAKLEQNWTNFKLRSKLFGLWFLKNILVFIEAVIIVLFILTLTGTIPDVFGLNSSIQEATASKDWVKICASVLSALSSVGLYISKAKSLTLADIKSDDLKLAMVKAGLYFNSDGKLVKKIEKITQTDLDHDGKIDETEEGKATANVGIISGGKRMIQEFITILKADFSSNKDDPNKTYNETLKAANLEQTEEGVKEATNIVGEKTGEAVEQISDKASTEATDKTESETTTTETEETIKTEKLSWISKIAAWFKGWGTKIKEKFAAKKQEEASTTAEETASTITTTEETKTVESKVELVKQIETKPEVINNTPAVNTEVKVANSKEDFLNKLKNHRA